MQFSVGVLLHVTLLLELIIIMKLDFEDIFHNTLLKYDYK